MAYKRKNYIDAVMEGRKKFLQLTIEQQEEIYGIYQKASKNITDKLKNANVGTLNERYLKEMDKALKAYTKELNSNLNESILRNLGKATDIPISQAKEYFDDMEIGMKTKQSFIGMFTNIGDDVVRTLIQGDFYKDGHTLSQRVWNISKRSGQDIDKLIKVAVAEQKSVNELAKELEKYLNPLARVPQKTLLNGINRNISYPAVRLARTSLAHAQTETYVRCAEDNPFTIGLKWNLSSSHAERLSKFGKSTDICDEHAKHDGFGLGKGIYPPDRYPLDHPNGLCFPTYENLDTKLASDEIIKWINGKPNDRLDRFAKDNGFDIKEL